MFFENLYASFLGLSYFWIIFIVSVLITVITTLVYKYTTDQKKLKENKETVKKLRKKMNENKDNQKKMMEIQQEMMSKNMEMMKSSFKPMLFTFIPLILLFSWMSGTLAYEPLMPGEAFTVTVYAADTYASGLENINLSAIPGMKIQRDNDFTPEKDEKQVRWVITPEKEGEYSLLIESPSFKETKEVIISSKKDYAIPLTEYKDSQLSKVVIGNEDVRPFEGAPVIGGLNWLWAYIILSLITSIGFRKALGVA